MGQVKVYGRRDVWAGRQRELSDLLQSCLVDAWGMPEEKRFHRFLLLEEDDFVCPQRSERYLIIEVLCFTGRSDDAKRALIRAIYDKSGFDPEDVEINIIETPKVNWGIRGVPADELTLSYKVEV
ncbi:phenylpyruvate tautomerase PptA (4-oxalocrotonate tautomerase family) [Nonomuraea thailandensis]|uniref:Phenylpyruvate tautomerase PptA (4-oxalocrotonate tautomerase family) n=1 Tax=Nonomuraea thailandensis TaxID=1188745 RepID=A0A9X2GQR2_9ACTN|nr:tautomerase family protein [Nonomuraea thailandensis]MCP2363839.1 phenylpyruvate tautomerase PptA (4-oxalocrotonate tautomerase family) [Nonomuraea thailandensis]